MAVEKICFRSQIIMGNLQRRVGIDVPGKGECCVVQVSRKLLNEVWVLFQNKYFRGGLRSKIWFNP